LIKRAQLLVKEQTGIELEPEVRLISDSECMDNETGGLLS